MTHRNQVLRHLFCTLNIVQSHAIALNTGYLAIQQYEREAGLYQLEQMSVGAALDGRCSGSRCGHCTLSHCRLDSLQTPAIGIHLD
jgi:hypothetical protein